MGHSRSRNRGTKLPALARGIAAFTVALGLAAPPADAAFRLATGTYVGNGIDGRAITGLGFAPDAVMIKSEADRFPLLRTSTMAGDASKELGNNTALGTNRIESLDADGFTVGSNLQVNASGVTFHWTAWAADAGEFAVGSYVGDGLDDRDLNGLGFAPGVVIVASAGAQHSLVRYEDEAFDRCFRLRSSGEFTDRIQDFLADGFQVGTHSSANASGVTHHYLAWRTGSTQAATGSYTGDGVDDRDVAGLGFEPTFALISPVSLQPVCRSGSLAGDLTLPVGLGDGFPDGIQAFQPDGFQVGTEPRVNDAGRTHYWMAFRDAGTETDLQVAKSVDDANPTEGALITYTVDVTNAGPENVTGVEVTDLLPAGVTYQSDNATQGSYASGSGVWTVGSLNVAETATLAIQATVDKVTAGSTIVNTASITASDLSDPVPGNDADSVSVTVQATVLLEVQVTSGPDFDQRPSWSPDGARLAFDSDRNVNTDIFSVPATGGPVIALTTNPLYDQHPDWSPDGTQIAFAVPQSPGALTDLWVMPAVGGPPTLLVADTTMADRWPAWSPDGTQIAFEKMGDIYVVSSSGGVPVQVTTDAAEDVHPSWSPDGTMLAFLSSRSGNNDVWVISATGGVATQITTDPANDGAPDWSPSGAQIAFHSNRGGTEDLWTIPATGGTAIQRTSGPESDFQPSWSPSGDQIAFSRDGDLWLLLLAPELSAELAISKAVDDPAPNAGDTIEYTIVVTNLGPASATGVEVTDVLPAGVTFSTASATQGTYSSGSGIWNVGTMADATSDTLTITVTVDPGTGGSTIVNATSVTASDQENPLASNDSAIASITVPVLDLSVTKDVDDSYPLEGQSVTYSIVVTNLGPDPATGVEVNDPLPVGLTFDSALATQGVYDDGTGVWSVGAMELGESHTLQLAATVDGGTGGTKIVNAAGVSADQEDLTSENDTDDEPIFALSETQITNDPASDQRPSWSPDGLDVVFDSDRAGNGDLWRVASSGGAPTQLTTLTLFELHPDWSPDGTQIAFASPSAGGGLLDLWLIPSGGGIPTLLAADSTTNDRFPSWSPDGSQIAFTKDGDLYLISSSGGVPTQLTTDPANDAHPSWSPDGSTIVFLSDRSGNNDLWTIPAAGGAATQLTFHPMTDGAPDWSPDGTRIAFQSNRSGNNDIWMLPIGGTPIQVTTDMGIDVQPDWSPSGEEIVFARDGNLWMVTVGAPQVADLGVEKTVDDPNPDEGGTVTFTVVMTNHGPGDAMGVAVTDLLPAGLTYQSNTTTQGTYASGTGVWMLGSSANAQSDTLTVTAMVDVGTGGSNIVNTASITGSSLLDSNPSNDGDTAAIDVVQVVAAGEVEVGPSSLALGVGRPNPFRQQTTIEFDLPAESSIRLGIFDVSGRRIAWLVEGKLEAGRHQRSWAGRDDDGRAVAPGVYFVRLESGESLATRKIVRIR